MAKVLSHCHCHCLALFVIRHTPLALALSFFLALALAAICYSLFALFFTVMLETACRTLKQNISAYIELNTEYQKLSEHRRAPERN